MLTSWLSICIIISMKKRREKISWKKFTHGIITGAADNDPSGITTYSIVGATTGLTQLWLVPLATPLLINIQSLCAKIGDVKKQGLAQITKEIYGKKLSVAILLLLITANTATLGANFAAIAASLKLVFPGIDLLFVLPLIALFIWFVIVFNSYHSFSKILALLSLVFVSYVITGIKVQPDWGEVITRTFIPTITFSGKYFIAAVGFLGTTIAPYLFYWQVTQEIEDKPTVKDANYEFSQNSLGFIISNTISYFIIITTANLFFSQGQSINTAADAAAALRPLAGPMSEILFAIGIIGSGLLAIPVLAAVNSYAISETFGWKKGLNHKPNKAKGFYSALSAAFLCGLAISLSSISPIKALFYSQVFNGFLTPFLIIIILLLVNNPKVIGKYTTPLWQNVLGWLTTAIMFFAIIGIFVS